MPRCGKCHSQWATLFRCPHCEAKFPCPLRLLLTSLAVPAAIAAAICLLFSFTQRIGRWQSVNKAGAATDHPLTVEIDKSGVE